MFKNIPVKTAENGTYEEQFDNDQLVSMIHRLMTERDVLWRENEYLKAKLNESLLIETINEMRKEREVLMKLLLNLSPNQHKDESLQYYTEDSPNGYANDLLPPTPYQTYNTTPNGKSHYRNSPSAKKQSRQSLHRDFPIPIPELKASPRRLPRSKGTPDPHPTVVYRLEGTRESLMNPNELSSVFAHVKHSHPNKKIVVYKTSTTPQTHEFNQLVDQMCVKHGVELKHSQNSPFEQYRSQSLQDLTSTAVPPQRDFDFQFQPIEKHEPRRTTYSKK